MSTDNQELKSGDLVEILIPELTKGVTGTLMRACSNDCVVIAIDRKPIMQIRVNISRHLVRKVEAPMPLDIPEPDARKPAAVSVYTDPELGGLREFYSKNEAIPSITFDPSNGDIVIEDAYPLIDYQDLNDFAHLIKVVEATANDNSGDSQRSGSKSEIGAWDDLFAGERGS